MNCTSQSIKDQSRNRAWCRRCSEPVTYNVYAEAGTEWTHMTRQQAAERLQDMESFLIEIDGLLADLQAVR